MNKGVIFDLDQTIVKTEHLEALRKSGQWKQVYSKIETIKVYDGIPELLNFIKQKGIKISIVTNSPRIYCEGIVKHFNFQIENLICYHDVKFKKPNAEPILKAIGQLNLISNKNIISIGDKVDDLIASQKAGITTVGAIWDSNEIEKINQFKPDYIAHKPINIISFLNNHWAD